jgi:hypothetical protein
MIIFYSTNSYLPNYISVIALWKQRTLCFHNRIFSSCPLKSGKSNSLNCLYQLLACSDRIAWQFRGSRYRYKIQFKFTFTFSKFIITLEKCFFYTGSRIYNHLLSIVKDLSNDGKHCKTAVKDAFWLIPPVAWRNTLFKVCYNVCSFHLAINMMLVEL